MLSAILSVVMSLVGIGVVAPRPAAAAPTTGNGFAKTHAITTLVNDADAVIGNGVCATSSRSPSGPVTTARP